MTVVIPFTYQPFHPDSKPYTVYMVNEDDPKRSNHVQGSQQCPHCKERNHFRVYLGEEVDSYQQDGWHIDRYEAKCPACKELFLAEFETQTDEGGFEHED